MSEESKDSAQMTSRRRFMARATILIGGIIGAVTAVPLVRYFLFPVGRRVVRSSGEPIDIGAVDALDSGAAPIKVQVTAASVRDAWTAAKNVPLGAAWVREDGGKLSCLSSVCPHLGCAVDFDPSDSKFHCPCHKSEFDVDGNKISGPSKRGLDPLEVEIVDGRVMVKWKRFKLDVAEREEA